MKDNLRVKNSIEDSEAIAKENLLYWAKVFWKDCFGIINEKSCYSEQYFVVDDFIRREEEYYSNPDIAKELYIVGNICSPIYKCSSPVTIPGFEFMGDFNKLLSIRSKED